MKTTKLVLALVLCFALFNGCSNEESFIEVEQESIEMVNTGSQRTASVCNESYDVIEILIEYEPGTTSAQKQAVRNYWAPIIGINSYEPCPLNDLAEIWTVGCVQFDSNSPKPKNTGISVNDPDISKQTNFTSICPEVVLINP